MEIDWDTPFGLCIGVFLFLCLVGLVIGIVAIPVNISNNFNAMASEQAQNDCERRGFDVYTGFNRKFLDSKALGITCGYVSYERKQSNVDTTEGNSEIPTVIVVGG